jgi:Uma2 family endonuclease
MESAATRGATWEDLLALSEDVRAEVLGGQLLTMPAPLPRHSRAQRSLGRVVGGPYDDDDGIGGPGGWWIFVEVDVRFDPHEIVRPDLSGWLRERLPDPGEVRPIDVVPDWVCEVVSPSTASRDRVAKRALYARFGVPYYWLVDPEARAIEALRLVEGRWLELGVFGDGDRVCIEPFEAVEIDVSRLFLPRPNDAPPR